MLTAFKHGRWGICLGLTFSLLGTLVGIGVLR